MHDLEGHSRSLEEMLLFDRSHTVSCKVNNGSMGQWAKWVSFLDGSYGALLPMTHLHIFRKHVVKATFVVGDN